MAQLPRRVGEWARREYDHSAGCAEGFTLIELLVVLLIIGVLLAIAIPTYLSVTNTASDNAAQADLTTALTGAKAFYMSQQQTYSGICNVSGSGSACSSAGNGGFQGVDTGISAVVAGVASTGPHVVSIDAPGANVLIMTSLGRGTPNCWGIADLTDSESLLGVSGPATVYFEQPPSGGTVTCDAGAFNHAGAVAGVKTSTDGFSPLGN